MGSDNSDVKVPREEDADEVESQTYSEMEPPISITIPPTAYDVLSSSASCSEMADEEDDRASSSNGSTTPSLSVPPSIGSSPTITTRSLGSRSSFDGFPSSSSSASLSSDRELVNQACISLRQVPEEVQTLDLSTNSRKPRRPLKGLKALSGLTNLVQLDLSGNAVERLDGLQKFTQLHSLTMPRNHLKTLSAPLFALKGLVHLDLSGNFIVHLPRAFSGLTMLEVLNLSGNNLGTLREVDVLAPLANLVSCSLAANPFCRLPTYKDYVVCKIRSLERLDDVEISRVARDRAAKRFGNAIFSQDACLREADRAHEDEQNRLLEAQSALEAENLRLKGELQVKSKLLQNKSRAWSSATEQLLQLQQEVAMPNLDRRRSVSLPNDEPSDAERIAMAIAARHQPSNSTQQRPQSAPRIPSPERSVEKRRGSFTESGAQRRQNESAGDSGENVAESRDAACMLMSPGATDALKRSKSKIFVDASCSPLRVIPPANITKRSDEHCNTREVDEKYNKDELEAQEYEDVSSPPQTWEHEEKSHETRSKSLPNASYTSCHQQSDRGQSFNLAQKALTDLHTDGKPSTVRRTSASLDIGLKEDELSGMHDLNVGRSARFPTFEDDTACPAYEDTHFPALQSRSSSTSTLGNRGRSSSYGNVDSVSFSGSHSLPPSPTNSPSRLRQWYRKQNELRLMTPPPSPPRRNSSPQYKALRPHVEASPLAPFVDKDVLARQIQALQSCKQSLLTEIRNEEHLLHVLKQESTKYADQIDCLTVNIQACLDGDPSAIRFSFLPPDSPRGKSTKLREEETGRARLEILRSKLRFAEDKEKEIETTMVRMTKRVLHADLNPTDGKGGIREKFSPVESSSLSDVPFDKEIFALTHKLQLVIVEKEEIHMQMSQLMAQLRGQTTAAINFGDSDDSASEGGVSSKQVQSLASSRQMVDELRTRHREVTDRIELKERRISSLLEELKEVEAELKHISSLNASSALSPLFQRERESNLDFLQAMRSQHGSDVINSAVHTLNGDTAEDSAQAASSSSAEEHEVSPIERPPDRGSEDGGLLPTNIQFKELLNPEMLEEIKADIYEKLSLELASSAGRSGDENATVRADLHQAIATALEIRLKLGHGSSEATNDSSNHDNLHQSCPSDSIAPTIASAGSAANEVCCGQFDEFAPVEAHYARKYVMVKDRVSAFVNSINGDESNTNSMVATHVTSAQRILKICERLETAEARSKFDPVSKIEVDQQGNSRGSLKILLLAARDLPTAHLRTKNLDPYVCLEVVYPPHALPPSSSVNLATAKIFRSQTKKKSIYPVWDEDFEFLPLLSLNGYLNVRVLNDRRLSREQLVGETRIPLQTLLHQKRIVEWFSLGLNVPPTSTGSASPGIVVSKLCGGAVRLQLQLYFSSVERYKHVVDELVMRHLHDHNQLPPFIDAVGECENRSEQIPAEQPEHNGTEPVLIANSGTEPKLYDQRLQASADTHFALDELETSLPPYTVIKEDPLPFQGALASEPSKTLPSSKASTQDGSASNLIQMSSERKRSLWEMKPSVAAERPAAKIDEKKPYFGFSANTTERKLQLPAAVSTSAACPRRSQTPTAHSKRIRNAAALQQHTSSRRRSVETPECFDEYSPYHPAFKNADILDGMNNELGGARIGRTTPRGSDANRKTDLSIFKSPSLSRRPPSSGFPERYIGLDNQTCERLKRIFGRMDGTQAN
ncbi:unnamed protein product [Phytophthora lilii]|uniref:Unnamed protein product n=1 Tax=Phytophthora lilii TaxID=2077276 RepID=A0A9W6TKM9_9STRA|nr:unnamed protein product [Phytophthora lilii]